MISEASNEKENGHDIRHERYPGPPPFEDTPLHHRIFNGREAEIENLKKRAIASQIMVLFGKSGLGKTSLLQAGLFPSLREEGYLPIMVRLAKSTPLIEIIEKAAKTTCEKFNVNLVPGETGSLWEYFKTVMFWSGDTLMLPVLVFDQFEEIFNLHDPTFRADVAKEIGPIVSGNPPDAALARMKLFKNAAGISETPPKVKIIISLKEEYLGALQELSLEIPGLFQERFRLHPLQEKQAENAIREPALLGTEERPIDETCRFDSPPFYYDEGAITEMLSFLKGRTDTIEPFQIQLLCQHVEQLVRESKVRPEKSGVITVTRNDIGGPDEMNRILQTFYTKTITDLPLQKKGRVRQLCETGLLDASGHRLSLEKNQIREEYKVSDEIIGILVKKRLLREEPRLESLFYEISHDTLAHSIVQVRGWRLPKKYRLALIVGAAALAILILFGTGFIFTINKALMMSEMARKQAENLVSFIANEDFMEMIRPSERLKLTERITREVAEFTKYATGIGENPASPFFQGLVALNHGNLEYDHGQLRKAQSNYQEAFNAFSELTRQFPENVEYQRHMAKTMIKLGMIAEDQLRLKDSMVLYRQALDIRQQLADANKAHENLQRDLAENYLCIARILRMQGYLTESLNYNDSCVGIAEKYADSSIEKMKWLSIAQDGYCGKGRAYLAQGKNLEAERVFQKYLEKAQQAAQISPSEPKVVSDLYHAIYWLESLPEREEKPLVVLERNKRIFRTFTSITKWDPDNAYWQREASAMILKIGETYDSLGNSKAAMDSYNKALPKFEDLAKKDETHAEWQTDLVWAHTSIGYSFIQKAREKDALQNYEAALLHYNAALKIQEPLATIDDTNTGIFNTLAGLHIRIGNVWRLENNPEKALGSYQSAADVLESRKVTDNTDITYLEMLHWLHRERGDALLEKKDFPGAMAEYKLSEEASLKAIDLSEGNTLLWNRLFLLFFDSVASLRAEQKDQAGERKAYRDALAAVEKAAALSPKNPILQGNYFYACRKNGDYLYDQGKRKEALAAYAQAEKAIRRAIDLKEDAGYWNQLFLLLFYRIAPLRSEQDDPARAHKAYSDAFAAVAKAVALAPDNVSYRRNRDIAKNKLK